MLNIVDKVKADLKVYTNEVIGEFELIREKDGVWVFRSNIGNQSVVVKYFESEGDRREIFNYKLLSELNIPTMEVLYYGDTYIILEDIDVSPIYRLGTSEDLLDEAVAKHLATWYFDFHEKGYEYIYINELYSEIDFITLDNLKHLIDNIKNGNDSIKYIIENYHKWKVVVEAHPKTLNYNDFYWTNLLVARKMDKAFPYDYNYLGAGHRDNDINNVVSSLSEFTSKVFLEAYDQLYFDKYGIHRIVEESTVYKLCKIASVLFTVMKAYEMVELPDWASEELDMIESKEFLELLETLLGDNIK